MTEYGRIHTDGSRSGGQPVQSDAERVARALAQADGIEICSDATYALSSYGHKAQAALSALRQPTQSSVAAAGTDRIGGGGGLPCGVVGVAKDTAAEWQAGYEAGVEAAIKALEADARLCDCAALEANECACGAWDDYKSITSARAVEIVRKLADTQ
jgi:hypothetical protein